LVSRSPFPVCQLSSGLSFEDGQQRLVSIQRPLGLVLEEVPGEFRGVTIVDVQPGSNSDRAGVQTGDLLVAINNLDVASASLEEVMSAIEAVPSRVLNLRFLTAG